MNKFNMKNTHRLGLKSNSVSKLYQTECVKKENEESIEFIEFQNIYKNDKSEKPITEDELNFKPIKIDIANNIPKVNTEPKMKRVVLNAYQKFLKKEFKYN